MKLLNSLSVSKKINVTIAGILALVYLAVILTVYSNMKSSLAEKVDEEQIKNITIAAKILQKEFPGTTLQFDTVSKILSRIEVPHRPNLEDDTFIDQVGEITRQTATVFIWDDAEQDYIRQTTNILKKDGARAVGTYLGKNNPVYDTIQRGDVYHGKATILGTRYYTHYQPVFIAGTDQVVGILYVGLEMSKFYASVWTTLRSILASLAAVGIISLVLSFFFFQKIISDQLERIANEMEKVSGGDVDLQISGLDRGDEIGKMARALQSFQRNLREMQAHELEKRNIEAAQNLKRKVGMLDVLRGMVTAGIDSNEALIDLVKMRGQVADTKSQAQTMATAVEELAASIEQISANSNIASTEASEAAGAATKGVSAAVDADQTMEKIVGSVNEAASEIDVLAEESEKIGAIVTQIEEIAEQTNLLALNATIEAARAGEAGKGFAVVATEVKTLANETSKATVDIRQRIEELRGRMDTIVVSIKGSAEAVNDGRDVVSRMGQQLRDIAAGVDTVSHNMTEVSSILVEQSAASSEVAQSVEMIAAASQKNDNDISHVLDLMDEMCGALSERISSSRDIGLDEVIIEITKNDHALYKKSIFDVLAGRSNKKAHELSDHKSCRLGQWYYAVQDPKIKNTSEFRELEADHIAVHQYGKDVLIAFENGDTDKAHEMAAHLNDISYSVVERLEKLSMAISKSRDNSETTQDAA